jgi:alkanesulfonate monooxygenase SsuD/methylene tetrahydromethanopterin reductase-like flavin-dependent oxidoreductase (luciferase family)
VNQTLHFGIKTTQYIPYDDIRRIWLEADTLPAIEHAWLFDHPMPIGRLAPSGPCLDGWTVLAALAAQTQRLRLGLMVASNANQTPAQLAKRASTLDVISGGRLEFGFGAGGVEREHSAYGTDFFPAAERVRRLDEACQIIRRLWTEPVVDFDGRFYHLTEAYCEPKPVQQPAPPFIIGGAGEQLTLRVVARHADVWNYPGLVLSGSAPAGASSVAIGVEDFQRKSRVLDGYCTEIGRDPAGLARSVQLIFGREDTEATRQLLQAFIAAGATHLVLGVRQGPYAGLARWLCDEIIEPVRGAVGSSVSKPG